MQRVLILLLVAGLGAAEIVLPDNLNDIQDIPAVKERCQKKGSPDSYDRIKVAANETKTCLKGKINPDQIKSELDEAKKTGSMDEVFGKYCKKRPEIKECILKTVNVSKECLEENEKTALDNAIRVIDEILDFACFRDGDRLAMFVAEGGVECISSRKDQIKDCVNATLKVDINGLSLTSLPTSLPSLGVDKKKCDDFSKIQQCVVADLETNCKDTTPSNIVDALFKFIKKTSCKNLKQRRSVTVPTTLLGIYQQFMQMLDVTTLTNILKKQCEENGGVNASRIIWSEIDSAKMCLVNIKFLSTPKDDFINGFTNCSRNIMPAMEQCLSNETKYYPSFFFQISISLMEFVYDHSHLLKITSDNAILYCLQRLKYEKGLQKINLCLSTNMLNQTISHFPTKNEMCQGISKYIGCVSKIVTDTCSRDILIDRFLGDAKRATEAPCV